MKNISRFGQCLCELMLNVIEPSRRHWSCRAITVGANGGLCVRWNVVHNQMAIKAGLSFGRHENVVAFIVWPIGLRLNVGQPELSENIIWCLCVHVTEQWIHLTRGNVRLIKWHQIRLRLDVAEASVEIVYGEVVQAAFILHVAQIVQILIGFGRILRRRIAFFVNQIQTFVLFIRPWFNDGTLWLFNRFLCDNFLRSHRYGLRCLWHFRARDRAAFL